MSGSRHLAVCIATLLLACGCAAPSDRAWQQASERWRQRDPAAFAAWRGLDATTDAGRRAHEALAQSDAEYRRGIALLSDGDDANARVLFERASARAPIDPALYLPLARACHRRGLDERAAALYQRLIAAAPAGADAEVARRELRALGDK
ncbi:MAG TPA: hypothetical protein VF334_02435, partial [Polyangia bacterium]